MKLWQLIQQALSEHSHSIISDGNNKMTYRQFLEQAVKKGNILKAAVNPKTKCVLRCRTNFNTALMLLACWKADLIPIPTSENYGRAHCEKIIGLTEPELVISEGICCLEPGFFTFDMLSDTFFGKNKVQVPDSELADTALIMCTSGTTGSPKGAMITEDGLIANIQAILDYFGLPPHGSILIARPLYHCAVLTGEFLVSLMKGLHIRFLDGIYHPAKIGEICQTEKISVLCGTPTLINHIAKQQSRLNRISGIQTMAISGECLPSYVAAKIRTVFRNTDIYNVYGLTEASPRVSFLAPRFFDAYPESVGHGLKNTKIKILNPSGVEVPTGSHGNIWVSSPSLMKGYYRNETQTQKVLQKGWLSTGDIGYMDGNGFLYILSRADDMIIKSGMNIYPKEIENAARQAEEIDDIVVYGKKKDIGQDIVADIVLNSNYSFLKEKDIRKLLAEYLPEYQLPNEIILKKELARNASGKAVRKR